MTNENMTIEVVANKDNGSAGITLLDRRLFPSGAERAAENDRVVTSLG